MVLTVTFAAALPGTKFAPSQTNVSPLAGVVVVVSTSESASIDLLPNAVSKSV